MESNYRFADPGIVFNIWTERIVGTTPEQRVQTAPYRMQLEFTPEHLCDDSDDYEVPISAIPTTALPARIRADPRVQSMIDNNENNVYCMTFHLLYVKEIGICTPLKLEAPEATAFLRTAREFCTAQYHPPLRVYVIGRQVADRFREYVKWCKGYPGNVDHAWTVAVRERAGRTRFCEKMARERKAREREDPEGEAERRKRRRKGW